MNSHRKAAASLVVPAKDIVPDRGSQQWMVGRDQVPSVPACEFLEWDSTFFGCRIARITANRITADHVSAIIDWCAAERIDCLYFLADPTDLFTIRLAEDNGFRCVDIRVTFEMRVERHAVSEQYEAGMLRQARPADVPELQAIARTGFGRRVSFSIPAFRRERPKRSTRRGSKRAVKDMPTPCSWRTTRGRRLASSRATYTGIGAARSDFLESDQIVRGVASDEG